MGCQADLCNEAGNRQKSEEESKKMWKALPVHGSTVRSIIKKCSSDIRWGRGVHSAPSDNSSPHSLSHSHSHYVLIWWKASLCIRLYLKFIIYCYLWFYLNCILKTNVILLFYIIFLHFLSGLRGWHCLFLHRMSPNLVTPLKKWEVFGKTQTLPRSEHCSNKDERDKRKLIRKATKRSSSCKNL